VIEVVKDKEKSRTIPDTVKYKAAEMLADPTIKTKKEIHESLPISEATLYSWLKEQEFIDMVNNKVDKYTDRELPEVWSALVKEAKSGNTNAIKLYFEMKNKYKDRKELSGPDGGAIQVDAKSELKKAIDRIARNQEK